SVAAPCRNWMSAFVGAHSTSGNSYAAERRTAMSALLRLRNHGEIFEFVGSGGAIGPSADRQASGNQSIATATNQVFMFVGIRSYRAYRTCLMRSITNGSRQHRRVSFSLS